MREIKFRGRRKHGKEILIGDLVRTCNGGPCIFPYDDSLGLNSPDYYEVDENTIGQYTGLIDKNGKEIYEGDIVTISYGRAIVKYIDECGAFILSWLDDMEANLELLAFSNNGYKRGRSRAWEKDIPEVIGNLYENPELI